MFQVTLRLFLQLINQLFQQLLTIKLANKIRIGTQSPFQMTLISCDVQYGGQGGGGGGGDTFFSRGIM